MNESNLGGEALRPVFTVRQERVQLGANCPVRAQIMPVGHNVLPHDHDYYEISIVRHGSAMHRTPAYSQRVKRGTAIVVPLGEVHAFDRLSQFEVINVYYLTEWLLADLRSLWDQDGLVPLFLARSLFHRHELGSMPRIPQFQLTEAEQVACERELAEIQSETARPIPSLVFLKSAFLKFLVMLSRAYVRQAGHDLGFAFRPEVWASMTAVERAIEEALPLSVEALARKAGVSPDHLCRIFKNATGMPPMDYFQKRRAQRAGLLLLNPRQSITEIAYALGYADAAHLSRMFRRWQGMSPREYRAVYGSAPQMESGKNAADC
jgi:AraC-like DNA-binding protein/quercetin dioxygenase-like cupin family protein